MNRQAAGWLCAAVSSLSTNTALADPPKIAGTMPFGIQRGVATELTINGSNLTGNPHLVAPFPFSVEPPGAPNADAANWKAKVTVPPNVAVGVYTVRVQTDDGISNPFLFAVGQLPQVTEAEDNSTFETAQAVPSPVVVEGQSGGNDVDFFRFPGKKGQRIVIDAQCVRLGSGVDPQIRLTTAGRTYVASADDTPGLVTDARLTAVLPEDGDYVVELSDTRYQGGNRPIYRLVIGPVPVADEVYPLGGRRGETVGFELRGGTLPDTKLAAATLSTPPGGDTYRLQAPAPGEVSLEVELPNPLEVSELPELREPAEPNAPPVRAVAPVVFNGRIDPPGDEDRFVLSVTPGQVLRVQVVAADLGSALDGALRVLGAKDAVLASADDTTVAPNAPPGQKRAAPGIVSPDPALNVTVPAGVNEITLALRDLEGRGGTGFPYRIAVELVAPTFDLVLADAQANIPKGGAAAIAVTAARRGYNGPIALTVLEPPPGLTVRGGTIAEGQSLGALSVSAAGDAAFGPLVLKVVGSAPGNAALTVPATKLIVYAQQGMLPTYYDTQVGLAAALAQAGPVTLEVADTPIEVVHGLGGPVPLKVVRAQGAEGALAVTALPMPPGLTLPAQNIAEKAAEASLNLTVAPEAPLGQMSVAFQAKGKLQGKDQTIATPAIILNIVRPAALELAVPAVEVKAGETVELKGKVVRKGAFKEPVTVQLNALPAGLKAEPVTVAPDASEFTLKIVADAGAAAAMANANTTMKFQINKKDYGTPATGLAVKVVK
jgi:hypothetical protein